MIDFPSFTSPRKLKLEGSSYVHQNRGLMFGKIKKLYSGKSAKYLANILLFDGSELNKVELPGPSYGKTGFQNGYKAPYSIGQKVLVGYLDGRLDCPVVLQTYSWSGGSESKLNLQLDTKFSPDEVSIGHESGHRMVFKSNKVVLHTKTERILFSIDLTTEEMTFNGDVNVDGDMSVSGDVYVDGDVVWNQSTVPTKASTHKHGTGVGLSDSPNPGL